ncbi:hypothetical protein A3A66_04580 [Microgenomates group bacterium RIFCSPLOWO2_01_FULL_46_13]|nr:MAG: hypothetical protein A2783_05055 [Microgenomates group bacterium RIFCSPHIGHO2_01_FULL_45_11]OGV94244.1 MAG: hypothetical protein A3A66_04580 [Microgenomates group bacterium RIFCSPLOWO2_01_FULL_46_13]
MHSNYRLTRLDSGLRLLTVPMPGLDSLTVLAMVGVGSRFEPAKEAGIAHFLEHMVFKGTVNYPSAMALSSAIDSVGGSYNAFTGKDYTGYYVKVAASHLELALDVISDMLLVPQLRPEDIEREKGVIVEEINMYEDEPQRKIADVYDTVVYGKTTLGSEIIGFKTTVNSLKSSHLTDFLNAWYNLGNVVLVVAGSSQVVSHPNLVQRVTKYFSKGQPRSGQGQRRFGIPPQTQTRVKLIHRPTEQAHFYLGVPGLTRQDKLRYVQTVLATVLGGNSSARLFNEIREKRGLAYYAYASSSFYQDTGSLYAFEGVDPKRIDDAIKVTLEQFASISGKDLTKKEVNRAKQYLTGKLTLDWEDSHAVAITYARKLVLEDKIETPDDILRHLDQVQPAGIRRLARQIFVPSRLNLALIGPYKEEGRFRKLVSLGSSS